MHLDLQMHNPSMVSGMFVLSSKCPGRNRIRNLGVRKGMRGYISLINPEWEYRPGEVYSYRVVCIQSVSSKTRIMVELFWL